MDTEDRITGLEIKFAHQDVSELNDATISQQKTIDDLEFRLSKMGSLIKSILPSDIKDHSEESPPPHY